MSGESGGNVKQPTTFDLKCAEVAKRLELSTAWVHRVFDEYEAVSREWAEGEATDGPRPE